jgi:3-keto-L-gulonate-6-phosphate decarboxylase
MNDQNNGLLLKDQLNEVKTLFREMVREDDITLYRETEIELISIEFDIILLHREKDQQAKSYELWKKLYGIKKSIMIKK